MGCNQIHGSFQIALVTDQTFPDMAGDQQVLLGYMRNFIFDGARKRPQAKRHHWHQGNKHKTGDQDRFKAHPKTAFK